MTLAVDIKILGARELEKKLKRLDAKVQKSIVRSALRKSAKRSQARVVANLSGTKVNVQTGILRQAFSEAKIRGASSRYSVRVGIAFPERDALQIPQSSKHYYPTAVEYGHGNVPPHPFMRPAIDEHEASEKRQIANDIGKGIEREAGK